MKKTRSNKTETSTETEVDTKVYYLAGPMSGIPQFNYPTFFKYAARLRDAGYTVVNPAEQDTPEVMKAVLASEDGDITKLDGPSWGQFLAHDVKLVADSVDALVVLPDWDKSKGACVEVLIATLLGKPVHYGVATQRRAHCDHDRFTVTINGYGDLKDEPGYILPKEEVVTKLMTKLLA